MSTSDKKPLITLPWLRVLLFGCCFFILTLLIAIPAVIFIAGITTDALEHNLLSTIAGLLNSQWLWLMVVLELIISVISVTCFRLLVDRRSFGSLGWDLTDFGNEALIGLLLGPALLGIVAVLLMASGHVEWTDITWDPTSLFINLGLMALIAFSEEIVFRGYILGNLLATFPGSGRSSSGATLSDTNTADRTGKLVALGISSLLFSAFHATNPGIHTLAFANLFLAGWLMGINYIYTKNLWYSFLLHLSWNFFQGPILGFKVSGLTLPSLLQAETKGDLFLTGGDFGLEGSILNTALSFAAVLVLTWAFERKYKGQAAISPARTQLKA